MQILLSWKGYFRRLDCDPCGLRAVVTGIHESRIVRLAPIGIDLSRCRTATRYTFLIYPACSLSSEQGSTPI
jgi:hypothetical protein